MQILYQHQSPPRTKRKAALVLAGVLMVIGLVARPPDTLAWTWGLWALASALLLLGTALLVIPPVIHIWITRREVILHPMTLRQRIPIQHIHDMDLSDGTDPGLTLYLRNGETLELTDWVGDTRKIAALLTRLGVAQRDHPSDEEIRARQTAGPTLV